jgi:hypothetical protein
MVMAAAAKAVAADHRQRLVSYYTQHAPSKIGDVGEILQAAAGREPELFQLLADKYEATVPPHGTSTSAAAFVSISSEKHNAGGAAGLLLVGDINTDLTNLNPIYGLNVAPKVPFREAVLGSGVSGLEGAVVCAELFAGQNPDASLDQDEVAALHIYTMESPFYPALNRALGSKNRSEAKPFLKYLRLALGAMYKLPLLHGMFARGIKNPNLANYCAGRADFIWWAFTSTTQNVGVTKEFLGSGPRMLFMIDGVGVDISKYSSIPEAEVLVLPGSMFRVKGVLTEGDLTITTLKQVPSPPMVDFAHPGLVAALGGGGGGGSGGDGAVGGSACIFEFAGLMKELGLLDADAPDIQPALQEHGLVSVEDLVGFLTDECGGVSADGLKQMGISKYGTRNRILKGLLKVQA